MDNRGPNIAHPHTIFHLKIWLLKSTLFVAVSLPLGSKEKYYQEIEGEDTCVCRFDRAELQFKQMTMTWRYYYLL